MRCVLLVQLYSFVRAFAYQMKLIVMRGVNMQAALGHRGHGNLELTMLIAPHTKHLWTSQRMMSQYLAVWPLSVLRQLRLPSTTPALTASSGGKT